MIDTGGALKTSGALKIGIVAGEKSGDTLGAGLIREIKKTRPDAQFSGLGGPAMLAEGFTTLAPMERLSVMGLIEPLKRLPELLAIRRQLFRHFIQQQVDLVVGIDSPDFNLGLEKKLKRSGITTCHYVCPSVWAWRQGRVKTIQRSVNHVLALLPFEADFLNRHGIDATFVGHPLADRLAIHPDASGDKETQPDQRLRLCVMPGSRSSEVSALLDTFLQTAVLCVEQCHSELDIVVPAATPEIYQLLEARLAASDMSVLQGRLQLRSCYGPDESHPCIRDADVVLLASGTATLETALLGKAMVVAYKMSPLGYAIASRLVKVEHIALPNLLLNERVVPEFVQDEAESEKLAQALLKFLHERSERRHVERLFSTLRSQLARQADKTASEVVLSLLR